MTGLDMLDQGVRPRSTLRLRPLGNDAERDRICALMRFAAEVGPDVEQIAESFYFEALRVVEHARATEATPEAVIEAARAELRRRAGIPF